MVLLYIARFVHSYYNDKRATVQPSNVLRGVFVPYVQKFRDILALNCCLQQLVCVAKRVTAHELQASGRNIEELPETKMGENMGKKTKKKKKAIDYVLTVVLIIAIGIFIFAAYNLIHIYLEYKKGSDEYDAIEKMAVTERDPNARDEEDDGELQSPIDVDFESLRKVNEDVIGWIYVEGLDISYPVVRGIDNEYYLHRTYEKTYNFAGTIFVDYENNDDFNDCNTLVYGHNMKNGSMFGTLKQFSEGDAYSKSHYFWILTPEKNYKYEIFSAYVTAVNSDTYTLFKGPGKEFKDWIANMRSNSSIDTGDISLGIKDKVVTLSTCTGNSSTRYVVQGKRLN